MADCCEMIMNAEILSNVRVVRRLDPDTVEVSVPGGWEDTRPLVGRVIEVGGIRYGFTGWNSDRNVAYFRRGVEMGVIL